MHRKPSAARKSRKPTAATDRRRLLQPLFDLEAPLAQALDLVRALELIGFGLKVSDADHGAAVVAVAEELSDRLVRAQDIWRKALPASKG